MDGLKVLHGTGIFMDLGNIYQNNINKNPIHNTGISSSMPVSRERDPKFCLLYTSPSPRDRQKSRMPSSA